MARMADSKLPVMDRLKADLHSAMKARQSIRVATLRTMVSALDNATAVEVDKSIVPLMGHTPDVPRKELSEAQQLDILRAEAAGRRMALHSYEQLGKLEEAARLRTELEVFTGYL